MAREQTRQGDIAGARAALDAAKDVVGRSNRPRSQPYRVLRPCIRGPDRGRDRRLYAHLAVWLCDALVVASAANPNRLIGASGRIGQKHQIAMLMDSLAPHYGDNSWFLSYHAMALSEDGQLAAARMKIEKSVAAIQARQQTERRFAVRVRIAVPPEGLGRQIEIMYAWLDETCGAEGWGTAPARLVGVLNDAIAFYFDDAAFAHAFVARFCCGYRVEAVEGAFALRNDTPPPRRGASVHKTP